MFYNLRGGSYLIRYRKSFFVRSLLNLENNFFSSTTTTKNGRRQKIMFRSFSSFDVAPLIGELSSSTGESRLKQNSKQLPSKNILIDEIPRRTPSTPTELPHWVQTPVDLLMFKAKNCDDLWKIVAKYQLTASQSVGFLVGLVKFRSTKIAGGDENDLSFEKEIDESKTKKECFEIISRTIISELSSLPIGSSALALRSLLNLGIRSNDDNVLIMKLREQLLKNYYLLNRSTLISFAIFHEKFANRSDSSRQLQQAMQDWICRHTNEFTDGNDLISIFTLVKKKDQVWYRNLETKLLQLTPTFDGDQLSRLLNTLASKRIRSISLLKAIANRYGHCEDDLTLKRLATSLSDLSILNYPNLKLLTAIFRDIETKIETANKTSTIVQIFSSLAVMRLRCVELLNTLCTWTRKHLQDFTPTELVSILLALARCNYSPTTTTKEGEEKELIQEIAEKISSANFVVDDKQLWLNAVWSLAVLGRLSKEHASSVLEKSFYEDLFKDLAGNDYKHLVTQLKLQNIDTAAKLEIAGYEGPFLDSKSLKEIKKINVVQYKEESIKILIDALNNLAPREKYMKTNVILPEGYVIDALLQVTADGKPLPIDQWEKSPPDSCRVAVMSRHFIDTTQMSESAIGLHAMATRHLNALHYVVLEVPVTEIEQRRQSLARVQFLKEKLDLAIHTAVMTRSQQ